MNVKKGIIALLIFPLFIISMMPLSVYADEETDPALSQELSAPFLGINIQITGYDDLQRSITYPTLNIDSTSVNQASAYIVGQLNCTSPSTPTSSAPCDVFSFQNSNGNTSTGTAIKLNLQNYFLKFNGNATINYQSFYSINYEFILDDNYAGYVVFEDSGTQFKRYVNGNKFDFYRTMSSTDQHTITIVDYQLNRVRNSIMNNFPVESWSIIARYMDEYNLDNGVYKLLDYPVIGNWTFPLFKITENSYDLFGPSVCYSQSYDVTNQYHIGHDLIFIFFTNIASANQSYWNFRIDGNATVKSCTRLFNAAFRNPDTNTMENWSCIKLVLNSTANINVRIRNTVVPYFVVPVYKGYGRNVSTDFAIQFGMTNTMLDDINHIANGTTNSNASVSSADQQNDTFKDQSSDLITQEEEFTSNMKQNLQQINTNFTFNNFGNKFMSSAVWVRDQYDHMITNTPFGTLVTFSMLLGLGLLIIGRTVNK